MNIHRERLLCSNEGEIPLSQIAKFFMPQNEIAKDFLSDSFSCGKPLHEGEKSLFIREFVAICTAPKGETLEGVLRAISTKGWRYGTLGDWYRYYIKYPLLEKEKNVVISTPGTSHLDEGFRKWIPFVSPDKNDSSFRKIIRRDRGIIAKVSLKPAVYLEKFQTERDILVYRLIEEKNVFPP